jgi:hypothetical protein
MRLDALPSPGFIPSGPALQAAAVKAISYVEVMADLKGGRTEQARTLDTFLVACRNSISTFIDSAVPTFVSGLLDRSDAPRRITLTFSEPLQPDVVPAVSAFVATLGGAALTETAVTIVGNRVHIDLAADVAAGTLQIAYTQPGTNGLRDLSGNLVASITATTITNQA